MAAEGIEVYRGAGGDAITVDYYGHQNVARGGTGDDSLTGPGWVYGGPGDDYLTDSRRDYGMLVDGPGSDYIDLLGDDEADDVVRARGGGIDTVRCLGAVDWYDVLYVDPIDRVLSSCRTARTALTGRPRLRLVVD